MNSKCSCRLLGIAIVIVVVLLLAFGAVKRRSHQTMKYTSARITKSGYPIMFDEHEDKTNLDDIAPVDQRRIMGNQVTTPRATLPERAPVVNHDTKTDMAAKESVAVEPSKQEFAVPHSESSKADTDAEPAVAKTEHKVDMPKKVAPPMVTKQAHHMQNTQHKVTSHHTPSVIKNEKPWAVQVGVFGVYANAAAMSDKLHNQGFHTMINTVNKKSVVLAGPFASKKEADIAAKKIDSLLHIKGIIKNL